MSGIGHNRGPGLTGSGWARHCWQQARAELFPTLPIEVVRLRVRRAAAIGLDYRTYAGIRATTGQDLTAFLYSTNLLRMLRAGEADAARVARLAAAEGIGHLLALPVGMEGAVPALERQGLRIAASGPMPLIATSDRRQRAALDALRVQADGRRVPAAQVLLIAGTDMERDWAATGRLAWALPADRFFAMAAPR